MLMPGPMRASPSRLRNATDEPMIIFLCYCYHPYTTATYFERVLRRDHEVHYVGPPAGPRPGWTTNEDVAALVRNGHLPKPDLLLYIDSGGTFFPRGLERLDCPTAVYVIDVHQGLRYRQNLAKLFDHVFVCHRDYVDHFRDVGHRNAHWLPVACDPEVHGK